MEQRAVVEKILEYLELLGEDVEKIREEYSVYGDVEIDSLQILIVTGYLSEDFGLKITPAQIDRQVKRSFKEFCLLVNSLVLEER